jgi:hypothetical protein
MSDFRVRLESLAEDDDSNRWEQELDWDRETKKWSLSEREMGFGKSWILGENLSSEQLYSLLEFFRIDSKDIQIDTLARLSPGELALIHRETANRVTIFATLCEECGQHWYIFRWEQDKERWGTYGRTCEFSWRRGRELTEEEIAMLMRARRLQDTPLRPPE